MSAEGEAEERAKLEAEQWVRSNSHPGTVFSTADRRSFEAGYVKAFRHVEAHVVSALRAEVERLKTENAALSGALELESDRLQEIIDGLRARYEGEGARSIWVVMSTEGHVSEIEGEVREEAQQRATELNSMVERSYATRRYRAVEFREVRE